MNDTEMFTKQLFAKLVGAMEEVAHLLREGESREALAEALDKAAAGLRDDLHKGYIH